MELRNREYMYETNDERNSRGMQRNTGRGKGWRGKRVGTAEG